MVIGRFGASRVASVTLGIVMVTVAFLLPGAISSPAPASPKLDAETHFSSFFAGKNNNLLDSGWNACAGAITWSVDTGSLPTRTAAVEIKRLKSAFQKWSEATGLAFQFQGTSVMSYDRTSHHLSASEIPQTRHIAIAVMPASASPLLKSHVYGFGMPSLVMDSSNEIIGGALVLKEEVVLAKTQRDPKTLDNLYLHELGHVMGLGHVSKTSEIMFPTIYRKTTLGSGDITGATTITQRCR